MNSSSSDDSIWRLPPLESSAPLASRRAPAGQKRGREEGVAASRASGLVGQGIVLPQRGASQLAQPVPWGGARALVATLLSLHTGGPGAALPALPYFSPPSASPLLRLHEEMLDFCAFMSPTPSEVAIAGRALAGVHGVVASVFPGATVEVFGSRALGLVLPTSDWDLVCCGVLGTRANMGRLAAALASAGVARRTEVIDSARVPIVKAWEAASGICVDISFDAAAASARASRGVMADLFERFPPARPLALVLKYFLLQRGLNDTFTGGIGSYLLVLLSVAVVQAALRGVRAGSSSASSTSSSTSSSASSSASSPSLSAADAKATLASRHCGAELNLGALLLSAFELYGRTLNMWEVGISLRGELGGFFPKASKGWVDGKSPFLLCVESPVDPTQDVGRGAWGIQKSRRALAAAHCALSRAVRAWGEHAGSGSGGGGSGGGGAGVGFTGAGGGVYGYVAAAAAPVSLLGSVIRVDDLLRVRAEELAAQKEEAEGGGGGAAAAAVAAAAAAAAAGGGGGKRQKREEGTAAAAAAAAAAEPSESSVSTAPVGSSSSSSSGGLGDASAHHPPTAEGIRAAAYERLEVLAGGGGGGEVQLRHKRLLSDILTRKQRGVPAVIAAPDGWY